MSSYFRTPEMVTGKGFRCYNCGHQLAVKIDGNAYVVELVCRKCKAFIRVKMNEPVPWKKGEIHDSAKTG